MNARLRTIAIQTWMLLTPLAAAAEPDPAKLEFFEKRVRPILVNHCYACHSADTKPAGGLRLDDRNGVLTGGNTGAAVTPGNPGQSLLLKRVSKEAKRRMPAEGSFLTDDEIATLTQWVKDGATWTPVNIPASLSKVRANYDELRKTHWAWQPLADPKPPQVKDQTWPRHDIDRFLLARLEAGNLRPVRDAEKLDLIRRLTFDLTGLPPTPLEIERFRTNESADAYEQLVDRLLASTAFGEQWGRHWLDVARYGESTGPSRNIPYPHAWRYRDYIIDAVNADVPFNRFVQEQIAGDLLPAASDKERDRLRVATGFLALGVKDVNQRFKVRFVMDNVDEQIDAVTRSTLALTVTCARCHDHKFDPVPQSDYYALAGIFTSTDNAAGLRNQMGGAGLAYYVPDQLVRLSGKLPPPPADQVEPLKVKVAEAKKAWDAIRGTPEGLKPAPNGQPTQRPFRLRYERLQAELLALTDPGQRGEAAHGARDAKEPADTEIRIRGEAEKTGPKAPRGFLTAFAVPDAHSINPHSSGRLELAQWLTSASNPLTARVYVNRVWSHLFGRGICSSVDNFGASGDLPSNPELLDYLANRFIRDGWSTKQLIRTLVLTRAYQLSSEATPQHRQADPANILVWRHSPRRLTADEFRDGVLAASGQLEKARPQGSPVKNLRMVELRDNGPEAAEILQAADKSLSRSLYLPLLRGLVPRSLQAFDPVEQTLVTGSRENTTVPSQALFLMNSPFIRQCSVVLAESLLKTAAGEEERLKIAYSLILGRAPSELESRRALAFLSDYETAARENWNEVQLASSRPAIAEPKPNRPNAAPANPDEADQSGVAVSETIVRPQTARAAAWLALVQSLFGSAEFRFVK